MEASWMSLLFIVLQFVPSVIVRHGEGEGASVPFLNIQNACSFVSSIKHRIIKGEFFGGGREKILKNNTWFPLGVF